MELPKFTFQSGYILILPIPINTDDIAVFTFQSGYILILVIQTEVVLEVHLHSNLVIF